MKRARAYLIERERERDQYHLFNVIYLLFLLQHAYILSPPLCDQRCVRDSNYKERHTNTFEQTRRGISLPTKIHTFPAQVCAWCVRDSKRAHAAVAL